MSALDVCQAVSSALSRAIKAGWSGRPAVATNQMTAAPAPGGAAEAESFTLVIRYYSHAGYAKARTLGRSTRFHPGSFQSGDELIPEILRRAHDRSIDIESIIEARVTSRKGGHVADLGWAPLGPSPEHWRWMQRAQRLEVADCPHGWPKENGLGGDATPAAFQPMTPGGLPARGVTVLLSPH